MMTFNERTHRAPVSLRGVLSFIGAAVLAFPVLATPRADRDSAENAPGDGADQRSAAVADDELVGTLPIFWDPDTGMPQPEPSGADGDDEDDDDPAPAGGGGLIAPDLPDVQGAPRLFLYGPYHLLGLHQSAFDSHHTGTVHLDTSNPGFAYLVLDDEVDVTLPATAFTIDGLETGILIGDDELDPVVGSVAYLGQYSRPFQLRADTKKDVPVGALSQYGFLSNGVAMLTRSTIHGRHLFTVKESGDSIHLEYRLF